MKSSCVVAALNSSSRSESSSESSGCDSGATYLAKKETCFRDQRRVARGREQRATALQPSPIEASRVPPSSEAWGVSISSSFQIVARRSARRDSDLSILFHLLLFFVNDTSFLCLHCLFCFVLFSLSFQYSKREAERAERQRVKAVRLAVLALVRRIVHAFAALDRPDVRESRSLPYLACHCSCRSFKGHPRVHGTMRFAQICCW